MKQKVILLIFFPLLLLYVGSAFLIFYLPKYIESNVLPGISQQTGISVRGNVRRVGLTGMDMGGLTIGNQDRTSVSVQSIQLDYSPSNLLKKYVDGITISGLELNGEIINGSIVIPGLDWEKLFEQKSNDTTSRKTSPEQKTPFRIGSLKILNAVFVCRYHGQIYRLPFEFSAVPKEGKWDSLECVLKLYPRGQTLTFLSEIHILGNKVSLSFYSRSFQFDRFKDIVNFYPGLAVSGNLDIDGISEIQLNPFQISRLTAACTLRDTEVNYRKIVMQNPQKDNNHFRVDVDGEGGRWNICISNIVFLSPVPLQISEIRCNLQRSLGVIEGSGYYKLNLYRSDENQQTPIKIIEPLRTAGKFSAHVTKNGTWNFQFSHNPFPEDQISSGKQYKIGFQTLDITSGIPDITVSGEGENTRGRVKYAIQIYDFAVIKDTTTTSIPSISFTGTINIDANLIKGGRAYTAFELRASNTDVSTKLSTVKTPVFSIAGDACYHGGSLQIDTTAKFENMDISYPEYHMDITRISGEIPFQWPSGESEKKGIIVADAIHWNSLNLGTISGTLYQNGTLVVIECIHDNALIPGLALVLNGKFHFFSQGGFTSECDFKIPKTRLDAVDLGKFITAAEVITFSGELESEGNLSVSAGNIQCSLDTVIRNSTLEFTKKRLTIEKVSLTVLMTDLLKMHSAPNQLFSFKKASLGKFTVNEGKIEFQVESPQSVLLENSEFGWCSGHIYTRAMRVLSGTNRYSIDLYCDRLNLAEILEQSGIVKAKGSGTVSGRIPVRFENGNLIFEDGFLFSEPGIGGIIHIAETGIQASGTSDPRYSQLEFAKEALKKFRYNWVKLFLTTEREDLIVKMNLEGKPVDPLPFSYNRERGTFTRLKVGIAGKVYYSVLLDINFRLPLNKLLYYIRMLRPILKW